MKAQYTVIPCVPMAAPGNLFDGAKLRLGSVFGVLVMGLLSLAPVRAGAEEDPAFGTPSYYDRGCEPSVAVHSGRALEFHASNIGSAIYYRIGVAVLSETERCRLRFSHQTMLSALIDSCIASMNLRMVTDSFARLCHCAWSSY